MVFEQILLTNLAIHLLTIFVGLAFLWSFFLSVSTSKWNLEKSDKIAKLLYKRVYTKPNLCSSVTKLLTLMYILMSISFLKTLVKVCETQVKLKSNLWNTSKTQFTTCETQELQNY